MMLTRFCCVDFSFLAVIVICFVKLASPDRTDKDGSPWEKSVDVEELRKGKQQYDILQDNSHMPRYGKCWTEAILSLHQGCKQLTEDTQHRLALSFTNCFLQKMGKESYPCSNDQNIEECTKDMKAEAFTSYSNFFTHTKSMCHYLQGQVWQQKTQQTIVKLADNSDQVARQLQDSTELQDKLLKQQNESLVNQKRLIESGQQLDVTIQSSKGDINRLVEDFKSNTFEQRAMILEVFDKVSVLQSIVLGEFTGFYSMIFYALSVIICYFVTSTPRTSGARFWLFGIMTINIVLERLIVMYYDQDGKLGQNPLGDANALLYSNLWLCRKVTWFVSLLLLGINIYRYQDINQLNNELLLEIRKQNSDLKRFFLNTKQELPSQVLNNQAPYSPVRAPTPVMVTHGDLANQSSSRDTTDSSTPAASPEVTTGYHSEDEYSTDSDSDATFILQHSDQEGSECSDSDVDSFYSSPSRRASSRDSTPSLMEELRDLCKATPLKGMLPFDVSTPSRVGCPSPLLNNRGIMDASATHRTPVKPVPCSLGSSSVKKRGPKPKTVTSPATSERPGLVRYNLRHRPPSPPERNPVVRKESPNTFAKKVKHLAKVAQRNNMKMRHTILRQSQSIYSEDD